MRYLLASLGALLALCVGACVLLFIAIYLVIREVTIFVLRWLHQQSAAKSARG